MKETSYSFKRECAGDFAPCFRIWINRLSTANGVGVQGRYFMDARLNISQHCALYNRNHRQHCFGRAVVCTGGLWLSSFSHWQWCCNGNSSRTPVEEKQKLEGITRVNSKIFKNLQYTSDGDMIGGLVMFSLTERWEAIGWSNSCLRLP